MLPPVELVSWGTGTPKRASYDPVITLIEDTGIVNALVVSGVTSARLIAPPNLVLSLSVVRIRLL